MLLDITKNQTFRFSDICVKYFYSGELIKKEENINTSVVFIIIFTSCELRMYCTDTHCLYLASWTNNGKYY